MKKPYELLLSRMPMRAVPVGSIVGCTHASSVIVGGDSDATSATETRLVAPSVIPMPTLPAVNVVFCAVAVLLSPDASLVLPSNSQQPTRAGSVGSQNGAG